MTSDFAARLPRALDGLGPGSRIAGYLIEERIGAGGMAVVFRARDETLGRLAAVKVIAPSVAADPEFRARFVRESRAADAVGSLHIIPVYGAGEAGGLLYVATRFVAGGDLAALARRSGGVLGPGPTVSLLAQVASALDAVHAAGLVHHDVKPGNILVDTALDHHGHAFLADFGLSTQTQSPTRLTVTGRFVGTPDYAAPEQIRNQPVDGRTDQYALACVAFALLTGAPPFRRREAMATLYAQVYDPVPAVTDVRPELPAATNGVIARGLAKSAADRYASCGEFAEALREALDPARSVVGAGRRRRPALRLPGRKARVGGAGAVLLVAAGLICLMNLPGHARDASPPGPPPAPKRSSTSSPSPRASARPTGSATSPRAPSPPGTIALRGLVDSVQFSPDGKFMAATSGDAKYSSKIYVVNTQSNSLVATLAVRTVTLGNAKEPPLVDEINFSTDDASLTVTVQPNLSGYAAVSSLPYVTYRWNLATGQRTLVNSFTASINDLVYFSGDGQTTAEEDQDHVVYFSRTAGPTLPALMLPSYDYAGIELDNDGDRLLAYDFSATVAKVWDTETGQLISSLPDYQSSYTPYLSPDGKTVLELPVQGSAPDSAKPTLWDVATGSDVTPTDPRWQQQLAAGSFSPDGSIFWTARSGQVDLWNVATHKYLFSITDPMGGENQMSVGPGGTEAAFLGSSVQVTDNVPPFHNTEYRQIYIWKRV